MSMTNPNRERRSSRPAIDTTSFDRVSDKTSKSAASSSSSASVNCLPFARAPLAPLLPQSQSASSSPVQPEGKGMDTQPRPGVGRPILLDQVLVEEQDVATHLRMPRKSNAGSTTSTRPSRRVVHAHTPSSSSSISSRRGSLPAIHLRPTSNAFGDTSSGFPGNSAWASDSPPATNTAFLTNDDLYSGLSTFTFGAAQTPPPPPDHELISPLTTIRRGSADRTPRPSVSGSGSHSSHDQENIPADRDEAVRSARSKMRAVDDGTRRPSLPTNFHSEWQHHADMATSSEPENDPNDPAFDTDVEVEGAEGHESLVFDRVSVHTFGGDGVHRSAFDSTVDLSEETSGSGGPGLSSHASAQVGEGSGLYEMRRGSLPMEIPMSNLHISGGSSQSRDREGSVATMRRPSRSLGDQLMSSNMVASTSAAVVTSSSQPQSKSDWDSLAVQMQDQPMEDMDAYHGLDMDYIMSGARRMSTQSYVAPINEEARDNASHGFAFSSWAFPMPSGAARRPSVATVASDTFIKHVHRWNDTTDWLFRKEKADGHGTSVRSGSTHATATARPRSEGMRIGTQELWRCPYVGRFKVDRAAMTAADPAKPQQRLTIKHIPDPFSKGNTRGGPGVVVHKHSRAIAFSIFRRHDLFHHRHGANASLSMTSSILLAPKKVQEQYTSTRTTSNLNTHGLLEDRTGRSGGRPKSASTMRDHSHESREYSRKEKEKEKKTKSKQRGKEWSVPPSSDLSREATPNAAEPWTAPQQSHSSSSSVAAESSTVESVTAGSHASSSKTSSSLDYADHTTAPTTAGTASASYHSGSERNDFMDTDDEDEHHLPRASHAEAFGALNPDAMGHIKPERRRDDHYIAPQSSRSFGKGLLGRTKGSRKSHPYGNPNPEPFEPPWMTMAPRSKQEEQERIIANIDESFRGVGLLPAYRTDKTRPKTKSRPTTSNGTDFLANVPQDSLYMLLPLWPGHTDPNSSIPVQEHAQLDLKLEDRQYLLVYYIPFERKKGGKEKDKDSKKRSRAQTTAEGPSPHPSSKNILLESFRVCSRLLGYDDLRGSGIRLPTDGLAVTGPLSDAIGSIPHPSVREAYPQSMIIAMCERRDEGVQFLPDGLEKLGLCTPPARRDSIPDLDPDPQLTPVGRAAVEMAWLGCMALTSFGNV
ncbi:hypothetical protein OE88DRAFT_1655858 [Heliocybe sulcata]|uniref:Uncharacterized protein n=1 Tax=Heliocybe sulcata TaxID=5364 RepID=A0A5C3N995_9AGAM|nr:hypothetical protein OE88DRAFT_1655858 [Heliocybe sulcata]